MPHTLGTHGVWIYKGENKIFLLSVLDGDNNPIDLAGSEIYLTIRPRLCDDVTTLIKSSLNSAQIEIKSPTTDGEAYVHFVPSDTEDLDHGDYVYDVWVRLTSGKEIVIIEPSLFKIKPAVTEDLIGSVDGNGEVVSFNTIITNAAMDIYVRADIGDDDNPGTITAPLATLTAAEALIPYIVEHPVIIHLGPHTGDGYAWPTFQRRIKRDHIIVIGDGAGNGDGFTEVLSSTVATAGSDQNKVVGSGFNATPRGGFGEYAGLTIEILTGSAAGDRRTIRRNTTTDIIPIARFSAAVASGDTFRIVRPAIKVEINPDYPAENNFVSQGLTVGTEEYYDGGWANNTIKTFSYLVLCNLELTGTINVSLTIDNDNVLFLGCCSEKYLILGGCGSYSSGIETKWFGARGAGWGLLNEGVPLGNRIMGAPLCTSWAGWCLSMTSTVSGSSSTFIVDRGDIVCRGFWFASRIRVNGNYWGIIGGAAWHEGLNIGEHFVGLLSKISIFCDWETIEIGGSGTNLAIMCAGGRVTIYSIGSSIGEPDVGKLIISSTGTAIRTNRQGAINIFCYASADIEITGTAGLQVFHNSEIVLMNGNTRPTMNCSNDDDFSVNGGLTYHSISDLNGNAHFSDPLYGSIYQTGNL